MKPRIGVIPGDSGGIGPELVARLAADADARNRADILLVGDAAVLDLGQVRSGIRLDLCEVNAQSTDWQTAGEGIAHVPTDTIDAEEVGNPEVREVAGRSSLANLDLVLDLAACGRIDGVLYGPFNKGALHAAGMVYPDELQYMGARLGVENRVSELNTLGRLWTSRVTSHIPLRDVADRITAEGIVDAVLLVDRTLRRSGIGRPQIAVAALNPHSGDGGTLGREEIDVIRPDVEALASRQLAVDGPWPSDTIFMKARRGEVDAVVTMYHDQGQIALKLMGFERGVTVLGALPFPVATPAHGTAFDIAGKRAADFGAMRAAFDLACAMVSYWNAET